VAAWKTIVQCRGELAPAAPDDPGVIALSYLGLKMSILGYFDQSFATAKRALTLAHVRPHSFGMGWALQGMTLGLLRSRVHRRPTANHPLGDVGASGDDADSPLDRA